MKKAIAILLACIMLIGCAPVMSLAFEVTEDNPFDASGTGIIYEDINVTGTIWSITGSWTTDAYTITINEGAVLVIEAGGYLMLTGNGRLVNYGTIIVEKGGQIVSKGSGSGDTTASFYNAGTLTLNSGCYFLVERGSYAYNKGTIKNIDRMTINGTLKHWLEYPDSTSITYRNTEMWNRTETIVDFTVMHANDADLGSETAYTDLSNYKAVQADEGAWCEHGVKEYIVIVPEDGDGDWVDTGRMKLVVNGTVFDTSERIDNNRGVFIVTPVGAMSMEILSYNYKDIVKLFDITLPKTEGYYVMTVDGQVDEVTVEFGKQLSFTVVLDEAYDKSEPTAYIGMDYITPDEYGYFDVTEYRDDELIVGGTGGIQDDFTITIYGVSSNESKEQTNSIINFIKEIFETIKSIFGYFGDFFSGLLGGGTTETV